jgi:hypothetical protein
MEMEEYFSGSDAGGRAAVTGDAMTESKEIHCIDGTNCLLFG